jgi:ABC-type Fe3+-hydroxamate transport system substrate-binding protein
MKLTKVLPLLIAISVLSTTVACTSRSDKAVNSGTANDRASAATQGEISTPDSTAAIKNNQPVQTADTKQESTRPSTKTDTISVEGEKSEVTLKLYNELSQVFTTYFPKDDFVAESRRSGADTGSTFYYNVDGTKNKDVYVSISFPTWANNAEQLERLLTAKGELIQRNQWQMQSRTKDVPYSWAKKKIVYKQPGSSQNIIAEVYIGEANAKVFYGITHYPAEYGDGFAPRADLILKNLQVKG